MTFQILSRKELFASIALTCALSILLAMGFIPASRSLASTLLKFVDFKNPEALEYLKMMAFPSLSLMFFLSIPHPDKKDGDLPYSFIFKVSLLPFMMAFFFGLTTGGPSLFDLIHQRASLKDFIWVIVMVPVGEELLFRGWFWEIIKKLWPKMLSLTNPLPVSLWASSFGFSIWHFQNLSQEGTMVVLFQVFYTFFAGLWLGLIRWKSNIYLAIAAHLILNFLSVLV